MKHDPDVQWLLTMLDGSGAKAYLHQGCGCKWGSRGERSAGPECQVDRRLKRLYADYLPEPEPR